MVLGVGDPAPILEGWLRSLRESGKSDLVLVPGQPPRLHERDWSEAIDQPAIQANQTAAVLEVAALDETRRKRLARHDSASWAIDSPTQGRFRCRADRYQDGVELRIRAIPARVPDAAALDLYPGLTRSLAMRAGLVLIAGPPSSGRSTTVAALLESLAGDHQAHVATFEDTIEHVLAPRAGVATQYERHVADCADPIQHVSRWGASVVYIGEIDLSNSHLALSLAESGLLVFATITTAPTSEAALRAFLGPSSRPEHAAKCARLADALAICFCQRLLRAEPGKGLVLAAECLLMRTNVRNLLQQGKLDTLYSVMQSHSEKYGSTTLNQSLLVHVMKGRITAETALTASPYPAELIDMLRRGRGLLLGRGFPRRPPPR